MFLKCFYVSVRCEIILSLIPDTCVWNNDYYCCFCVIKGTVTHMYVCMYVCMYVLCMYVYWMPSNNCPSQY